MSESSELLELMASDHLRPTGERLDPERAASRAEVLLAQRHRFAYRQAATHGSVKRQEKSSHPIAADIGCGLGYGSAILSEGGLAVVGVDMDPAVLANASQTYGGDRCRFLLMRNRDTIPMEDSSCDLVVAFQVIEHVRDPGAFVAEISRITKDAGTFLLTTPNRDLRLAPGERPWNRHHLTEFDAASLQTVLETAFSAVRVMGIDSDAESKAVELERIKVLRRYAKLDPLRLRRFIPQEWIDRAIRSSAPDVPPVGTSDPTFRIVEVTEDPLDLFAVSTK